MTSTSLPKSSPRLVTLNFLISLNVLLTLLDSLFSGELFGP